MRPISAGRGRGCGETLRGHAVHVDADLNLNLNGTFGAIDVETGPRRFTFTFAS
jgi:hypothetical protein